MHVTGDEDAAFASADVVVAASLGQITAPGVLLRALGAGAVPVAARMPVYEEVLREGDLGLLFEPGDVDVLAAQLERVLVATTRCAPGCAERARATALGALVDARGRRGGGGSTRSSRHCATTPTRGRTCARGSPSAS